MKEISNERYAKYFSKGSTQKNMRRVLVIYYGGTIGMVKTSEGLNSKKGYLIEYLSKHPQICDIEYMASLKEKSDFLYMPLTARGNRIGYKYIEEDPVDSSEMGIKDWIKIAHFIEDNYIDYDGFVILNGTDTLAYLTSALSFMLENLSKPVICTGAMIPLSDLLNDVLENVLFSIALAGESEIPEVMLMFDFSLFRGNRVKKLSTIDLNAFCSPNFPPLATIKADLNIKYENVLPLSINDKFRIFTNMSNNIGRITIHPLISNEYIESFFGTNFDAIIIEVYSTGSIPLKVSRLYEMIEIAIKKNVIIVCISQSEKSYINQELCSFGGAKILKDMGVLFAQDMTFNCLFTKLSYLLGKYPKEEAKNYVTHNLRGELGLAKREDILNISYLRSIKRINKKAGIQVDNGMLKEESEIVYPFYLNEAISTNNIGLFFDLIREGANINLKDFEGRTPLHVATICQNLVIVELLLNNGAHSSQFDNYNSTPLYYAFNSNNLPILKLIEAKGGIFGAPFNYLIKLLIKIGSTGNTFLYRELLNSHIDVTLLDKGKTSLTHAAASFNQEELLLEIKATRQELLNLKNNDNETPLDFIKNIELKAKLE